MDEISIEDLSYGTDILTPEKQNGELSDKNLLHPSAPKRAPKLMGKKRCNRLTKVVTKRRKYARSKKTVLSIGESCLKDIPRTFLSQQNAVETSHLFPVVDLLERNGFKYEVISESHMQDSFYFQDKYMNSFYKSYPEFLCIDFLCEIPELDLTLCLFISIDGNGYCEVISVGLIKALDSGLLWLCDVFKKYNVDWHKIKLIVCDMKSRSLEVMKMAFPEKLIFVSFFHSVKSLKKDLINLEQKVSDEDINQVIHIFERMVYAAEESSYSDNLKQLKFLPPFIATFFKKIWHPKKDFWTVGCQLNSKTFLKSYNMYLLNIRKNIKSVVNLQDSLENVIVKVCNVLATMKTERFCNFTSLFNAASVDFKEVIYKKYSKFLTLYATDMIFEQFRDSCNVKDVRKLSCGKFMCASQDIVTTNACSCNFFQLLSLPCCHIFAIRKYLSIPLFAETLSSNRWIANNYRKAYLDLQDIFITEDRSKSQSDKLREIVRFQKYFELSTELWLLLVDCPENTSNERLLIFKSLVEAWYNGLKVNIQTQESQNDTIKSDIVGIENDANDYWKEMYGLNLTQMLDSDNDLLAIPLNSEFLI